MWLREDFEAVTLHLTCVQPSHTEFFDDIVSTWENHDLMPRGFVGNSYSSVCRNFQANETFVKKLLLTLTTTYLCSGSNKEQHVLVDLKKLRP